MTEIKRPLDDSIEAKVPSIEAKDVDVEPDVDDNDQAGSEPEEEGA